MGPMEGLRRARGDELTPQDLYALLQLRAEVFVVEQDCPYQDLDGRDLNADTEHLWIEDSRGVAAVLRILADPEGARIGRVITRRDRRGERLAARLMEVALASLVGQTIVLSAQSHLRAYYESLGFGVCGDEFDEDGIPHLPMRRPG